MQAAGKTDDQIVQTIVQEEGIVALSSPPASGGWGLFTWVMPGVALLLGFWMYTSWVRRNSQKPAEAYPQTDNAVLTRFRDQIDRELEASDPGAPSQKPKQK